MPSYIKGLQVHVLPGVPQQHQQHVQQTTHSPVFIKKHARWPSIPRAGRLLSPSRWLPLCPSLDPLRTAGVQYSTGHHKSPWPLITMSVSAWAQSQIVTLQVTLKAGVSRNICSQLDISNSSSASILNPQIMSYLTANFNFHPSFPATEWRNSMTCLALW